MSNAQIMEHTIYFSHANGFPASSYRKMLERLATQHRVGFIDTVGHSMAFLVTDCWPHLVDETIQYIEHHYDVPVIGVGHSLGGFLILYAAIKRPELFRAIIILDSPLIRPLSALVIWLAKKLGFIQRLTPGGNTLRRRDYWDDVSTVYDYFSRKAIFSRFDPDCLMDYAVHGTVPGEVGGRILKFRPVVEHNIYRTLPHDILRYRGALTVPAAFIAGSESDVLSAADLRWLQKHFDLQLDKQSGSHLFPLEQPLETANRILAWIPKLLGEASVSGK